MDKNSKTDTNLIKKLQELSHNDAASFLDKMENESEYFLNRLFCKANSQVHLDRIDEWIDELSVEEATNLLSYINQEDADLFTILDEKLHTENLDFSQVIDIEAPEWATHRLINRNNAKEVFATYDSKNNLVGGVQLADNEFSHLFFEEAWKVVPLNKVELKP